MAERPTVGDVVTNVMRMSKPIATDNDRKDAHSNGAFVAMQRDFACRALEEIHGVTITKSSLRIIQSKTSNFTYLDGVPEALAYLDTLEQPGPIGRLGAAIFNQVRSLLSRQKKPQPALNIETDVA